MTIDAGDLLERWREDLAGWAIPQRILDLAPASPWTPERTIFVRRAAARHARPGGISYDRAREALPGAGTVLDVGAGAGAASLPFLDGARALTAVDEDQQLLAALLARAGTAEEKVTTIAGSWPGIAASVAPADVVVCHHVLYNVPDLAPFVKALDDHARRRVVIEITADHPAARLSPLWQRFHGLARPTRPTWEDALRAIRSFGTVVHAEQERVRPDVPAGTWDELIGSTCRRLCLPADRRPDVAVALIDNGTDPDDPSTWSGGDRDVVTLWWDAR